MSPSPQTGTASAWESVRFLHLYTPRHESVKLAYREAGHGEVLLLLHEFGCSSWSWQKIIPLLSKQFRCIAPDLPGFGESDCSSEQALTPGARIELTAKFVEQLGLRSFAVAGHGMGGEIALGLIGLPSIRPRIRSAALISCGALEKQRPSYIDNIAHSVMTKPILNLIYSGLVARMILRYAYAVHRTPDPELCGKYAESLKDPRRVEAMITAAQTYARPAVLPRADQLPMAIIAGDEDRILSYEAAEQLHRYYPHARVGFLSGCGHIPQEECPAETAEILTSFILGRPENAGPQTVPEPPGKMRLTRLFDFWRPGTLFLIVILKILAFFRRLGMKVEQQSWRKISRFFLKSEYSKFVIGQFRLKTGGPESETAARTLVEQNLLKFLIAQPGLRRQAESGSFFARRRQQEGFCDLLVVKTGTNGDFLSVTPHFDPRYPQPRKFAEEVLAVIIEVHNGKRHLPDKLRPREVRSECRRRLKRLTRFRPRQKQLILRVFDRIMSGTFLFYDAVLPETGETPDPRRFSTPDFTIFRHPGWGQTNIICRFSADLREADLWWQFDHTLADGAPMQEILGELKKQWGSAGSLIFPTLNGLISNPEITDCGGSLCRARFFADFTPLLRLRTSLNRMCGDRMNGKASFPALLMWGLARHPYFRHRKMLLPVDCRDADGKRQLGLLVTRPDRFDRGLSPLEDFCLFQAYVNRHLEDIRCGRAETSEMLTLFGMLHPFFYGLTQKLYPHALQEMLGTVGISIIADAEVFVSPQTDIHINGFMALGSALIQTGDDRRAGSVCVSGTREQIDFYHEALSRLIRDLPHLLER